MCRRAINLSAAWHVTLPGHVKATMCHNVQPHASVKQHTLINCWRDVRPASETVGQYQHARSLENLCSSNKATRRFQINQVYKFIVMTQCINTNINPTLAGTDPDVGRGRMPTPFGTKFCKKSTKLAKKSWGEPPNPLCLLLFQILDPPLGWCWYLKPTLDHD